MFCNISNKSLEFDQQKPDEVGEKRREKEEVGEARRKESGSKRKKKWVMSAGRAVSFLPRGASVARRVGDWRLTIVAQLHHSPDLLFAMGFLLLMFLVFFAPLMLFAGLYPHHIDTEYIVIDC